MANRTDRAASTVKGTNPQYLIEKIIRMRVYDSRYWKEECFALSAELIVDKGMELRYIGGIYGGNIKPTPFLCLILKLLQIQPEKEIIIEFIRQEEFKYIRALGAMYMRLTGNNVEIYKYLEPLFLDYRKIRYMGVNGQFDLVHMDEFIDRLLREDKVCDVQLPRLQTIGVPLEKRQALEEANELEPRVSALEEDLDNMSSSSDDDDAPPNADANKPNKTEAESSSSSRRRDSRSPERRRRSRSRERDRRPTAATATKRSSPERPSGRRDGGGRRKEASSGNKRGGDADEREIREANELRASLGLAPLQP